MSNDLPPDLSALNYCLAWPSMSAEIEGRVVEAVRGILGEEGV